MALWLISSLLTAHRNTRTALEMQLISTAFPKGPDKQTASLRAAGGGSNSQRGTLGGRYSLRQTGPTYRSGRVNRSAVVAALSVSLLIAACR